MMAEKEYISYEEINSECKKLAYILAGCGFKRIIAVARGGLVPACVLAQFLGIRESAASHWPAMRAKPAANSNVWCRPTSAWTRKRCSWMTFTIPAALTVI